MNNKGSIGLICLLIVATTLLLAQSLYTTMAADYSYNRTYLRQRQVMQAVSSSMIWLEDSHTKANTDIKSTIREQLPPDDLLELEISTNTYSGVKWLVSKGKLGDIELTMVKALCGVPNASSGLYSYGIVAAGFNIDPSANTEATSLQNYTTYGDGRFVSYSLSDYSRYAFLLPDNDGWKTGIGKNILADMSGAGLNLASRTVRGSGVFVCYGDINIAAGSSYPERTQFITNGNVIVGSNVKLDNVFILAGAAVKISQGSRVSGKIFARSSVIIEKNTIIKDLPMDNMGITTDKYLW